MGEVISLDMRRHSAHMQAIRERLPEPGGLRWVPRRKQALLKAIDCGALSMAEARDRYALSAEELTSWRESLAL